MVGDLAASGAYTGATLIGWLVCGLGTLALCLCFYQLGVKRPDLQSGIFAYARDGFGEYIGFNVAWGYLLSAALTPIAFMALLFTTLSKFIPGFGNGSNLMSCVTASIILWLLCILIARGVKDAVTVNMIAVIAKIIPILVMILAVIFARAFKWSIFVANFWGPDAAGSILSQVKGTMFTTVWIFIGIEGAVVLSTRAKTTKVAGRAAVWSFLGLLALYMYYLGHKEIVNLGYALPAAIAAYAIMDIQGVGTDQGCYMGIYAFIGFMGHQLIGLASGGKTFKLKYGHRGCNHGVFDKNTGRSYITSQNHGYAVSAESVILHGLDITHLNLNDGTVEGMQHISKPVFSVQFHPESNPGPNDTGYLFDKFIELMEGGRL